MRFYTYVNVNVKIMPQEVTIRKTYMYEWWAHVLWVILHVEYDSDCLFTNRVHLGETECIIRSRSSQKCQFLKLIFYKNKGMSLMQNVIRNPRYLPLVFLCEGYSKRKAFKCMTSSFVIMLGKHTSYMGSRIDPYIWNWILWLDKTGCLKWD